MRRALVDMRPDRFEDIIALVALYRPGPMANIPTYCARKHGDEEPEYLHPMLEPILKETFGVIIYQEQVMQIAQVMAGYSLGEADLLRRAMGKKIRAEMEKQRAIFVAGAVKNGVPKGQAETIFELLAKFADYGFNKSHAAAYALVSYQTAYMKAHYPVEFLAASMTLDLSNTDKLSGFRAEAQRLGIKVEAPVDQSLRAHIRSQRWDHLLRACGVEGRRPSGGRADGGGATATGCSHRWPISPRGSIRAPSTSASLRASPPPAPSMRSIPTARGCLPVRRPYWPPASAATKPRPSARTTCSAARPTRRPSCCRRSSRGCRRTGCGANTTPSGFSCPAIRSTTMPSALKRLRVQSWAEFSRAVKTGATAGKVAATVVSRMERRTKTGNKMGIMGLSDPTGHFEAVLFSEGLAQYRDVLEPGAAVLLQLGAELQGEDVRARVLHAEPLDAAAAKTQKGLRIFVRDTKPLEFDRAAAQYARSVLNGRWRGASEAASPNRRRGRRRVGGNDARPRNGGGDEAARSL